MVIARDAPRPDLAHTFINFMLEARNSADLTNMLGSGNPNLAAVQFIKPEIKAMSAVFPDEATARKLEMPRPMNPEERRRQSQIWTEIKAR
jgi:spermidine/putrescine transport system substrate-binding protein